MAPERSRAVLIRTMHPALEGVVRLAASTVPGVDVILAVEPADLPDAIASTSAAIVVFDLQQRETVAEVRSLSDLQAESRVVLLVDPDGFDSALTGLRLGVHGFVRVPEGLETLPTILRRVARGERVIPSDLEQAAIRELGRCIKRARSASTPALVITPRERQVLELLAEGFTMRQIGRRLGISPRTAEAHTGKLYRKLTVRSRVEAITRGSALGLIELG